MNPAMYIFLNKGLGMSTGKAAAQAAHAAVEGYRLSCGLVPHVFEDWLTGWGTPQWPGVETDTVRSWYKGGHYTKLVMEAEDDQHLMNIQEYIEARGFKSTLIVDEGHTEVRPFSATALGVEIVDKDNPHVAATFGEFKLFKGNPSVVVIESSEKIDTATYIAVKSLVDEGKIGAAQERIRESRKKSKSALSSLRRITRKGTF